jgi:hypothetical protein
MIQPVSGLKRIPDEGAARRQPVSDGMAGMSETIKGPADSARGRPSGER